MQIFSTSPSLRENIFLEGRNVEVSFPNQISAASRRQEIVSVILLFVDSNWFWHQKKYNISISVLREWKSYLINRIISTQTFSLTLNYVVDGWSLCVCLAFIRSTSSHPSSLCRFTQCTEKVTKTVKRYSCHKCLEPLLWESSPFCKSPMSSEDTREIILHYACEQVAGHISVLVSGTGLSDGSRYTQASVISRKTRIPGENAPLAMIRFSLFTAPRNQEGVVEKYWGSWWVSFTCPVVADQG